MSGTAKKSYPPGSWPLRKGETAEQAAERQAAIPRSAAPAEELSRRPKLGEYTCGSSTEESQSFDYTTEQPRAQADGGPIEMKDETGASPLGEEQETVKGKGVEAKQVEEQGRKEVRPVEAGEKGGVEQQLPEQPGGEGLTEKAKEALDRASQGQPTEEAREAFMQAARSHLASAEEMKGEVEAPQEPQQEKRQAPEAEVLEKKDEAPVEIPEGKEEGEEKPEALEKLPAEAQEQEPAAEQKPEVEEVPAPEAGIEGQVPAEVQEKEQELKEEGAEAAPEVPLDFSILKNGTVNKGGNVVDEEGKVVGRVTQGVLKYIVGRKVDENGDIWSADGKVVGKAEPISESEREEMLREPSPFESFPDAVVDKDGMVVWNGEPVGKVVEGDLAVLRGKSVDPDGDILDKDGNVIGKAVRLEPEPEPEPEVVDKSILAGKRVNKAGNVVDERGVIFGRVVEGDVKKMVGRMCNKEGNVLSESGDILGKAELVPEGEREGLKEGPFAELEGCTVAKDGTVVTPSGDVVGRLVSGDPKMLFGRPVDEDGDILDRNGNVIGKAERWEPEKVERKKNPMSGRRVNREGNVVDEDGNIIGKLTSGDLHICSGKDIDDDGDVVDYKGNVIGHCTLLQDLPTEEPEEKEKREQAERDRKLAAQMAVCIEQCLDKIRPICKMITEVSVIHDVFL
ncbi:hypothetical protein VTK56DRAFT_801 [Thermocarpiscus australiensis]